MTTKRAELVSRRGELMAELFLQDIQPEYVAQAPTTEFGYDFLIGVSNQEGGTNSYAVMVKATEQATDQEVKLPRHEFQRLAHSNPSVLLLVVDVKRNAMYYAWPEDVEGLSNGKQSVAIQLTPVTPESLKALRTRMAR